MLYCNSCATKRNWPNGLFKSLGPCEICRRVTACSDIPSRQLPKKQELREADKEASRRWARHEEKIKMPSEQPFTNTELHPSKTQQEKEDRFAKLVEGLVLAHVSGRGSLESVNLDLVVSARQIAHLIIDHSGPKGYNGE